MLFAVIVICPVGPTSRFVVPVISPAIFLSPVPMSLNVPRLVTVFSSRFPELFMVTF